MHEKMAFKSSFKRQKRADSSPSVAIACALPATANDRRRAAL
jgi:hypothetical protein